MESIIDNVSPGLTLVYSDKYCKVLKRDDGRKIFLVTTDAGFLYDKIIKITEDLEIIYTLDGIEHSFTFDVENYHSTMCLALLGS